MKQELSIQREPTILSQVAFLLLGILEDSHLLEGQHRPNHLLPDELDSRLQELLYATSTAAWQEGAGPKDLRDRMQAIRDICAGLLQGRHKRRQPIRLPGLDSVEDLAVCFLEKLGCVGEEFPPRPCRQ